MRQSQRGAILVIALLIVSIITALAIDFSSRFQLSVGRAENRIASSRTQQCVFSIEAAVNWVLLKDRQDNDFDHFGEDWANPEYANGLELLAVSDACKDVDDVNLFPEDAQGRFNLNLLANRAADDPIGPGTFDTRYNIHEKRFIRLLQAVEDNLVTTAEAEFITQAVVDWLDADSNVSGDGGAESAFYLSQEKPYRAANQLFVSVTELRLIRGVTDAIYNALEDWVVALPDRTMGININTAPIKVMQALNMSDTSVPLDLADAETLESSRPLQGSSSQSNDTLVNASGGQASKAFAEVDDFINSSEFTSIFNSATDTVQPPIADGLTTETQYFLLAVEVKIDKVIRRSHSLLRRKQEPPSGAFRMHTVRRGSENVF